MERDWKSEYESLLKYVEEETVHLGEYQSLLDKHSKLGRAYQVASRHKDALEAIMKLTSNSAAYTTAAKAHHIAKKAMEVQR